MNGRLEPESHRVLRLRRSGCLDDDALIIAYDIEQAQKALCPGHGETPSPRSQEAAARFCRWLDLLNQVGISCGPVLDLVLDFRTLSAIDRKWRRRKGWAREAIRRAMALYPHPFNGGAMPMLFIVANPRHGWRAEAGRLSCPGR